MKLPLGFPNAHDNLVCKLQKSLYGLKQASRNWFSKLSTVLSTHGFIPSKADYSLFSKFTCRGSVHVLVYVDDIIIIGDDSMSITTLKHLLHTSFHIKDLGLLKYFLGIELARSSKGLFLNQRKYILDLLEDTDLLGARPVAFPMARMENL